ncbi:hypothetical protein DERF_001600 [Dermatophagoides farinae]|uniref:Uncharacterized protein n=1 Tax=Dermatophagoides farinae TaxID=6954 RepID=A0A922IB57_DERFA|nr:hypothetical protein DERF_001600 [Dermatophagoides farinae]
MTMSDIKCSTSAHRGSDRSSASSNLTITSNVSNISTSNRMTGVVERRLSANYRTPAIDLLPPPRASSQSITKKISNTSCTSSGHHHHHIKNPSSRVIINRQQSNILKSVKQQTDTSRGSVNSQQQQQQSSTASLASSASSSTSAAPLTSAVNQNRHRSAPSQQVMATRNHIEISPQSKNRHQTKIIPLTTRKGVHKCILDKSVKSFSKGAQCDNVN